MRTALAVLLATLVAAAPAAAQTETTVRGWSGAPGPRSFDRLQVSQYGSARARTVLVLMPGTMGGRGDFRLIAKDIVKRVPKLAVWAVDRRSNRLEDTSRFVAYQNGKITLAQLMDWYVGWIGNPQITDHYTPPEIAKLGYAADWGLAAYMQDMRRVVTAARRGGRRVILGGHSLGASTTLAYAAWDFNGRAGWRDLSGMVLIDGGLLGSFHAATSLSEVRTRLAAIRKQPFLDLLGVGLPWAAGVLAEVGAYAALTEPSAPSILQSFPLLPADMKAPVPATNAGQFGYVFDAKTSPKNLALIQIRSGRLGPDGGWIDDGPTPIARAAALFAHEPGNAIDWFYPSRLNLDVDAASPMRMTKAARELGLRLRHTAAIKLPLYALQTSLTHGNVLKGARTLIARTPIRRLPRADRMLVDASATESHLDPLTAAPDRSRFLQTVIPFLKRLSR